MIGTDAFMEFVESIQAEGVVLEDINQAQSAVEYNYVFVDQAGFEKFKPGSFKALVAGFRDYK